MTAQKQRRGWECPACGTLHRNNPVFCERCGFRNVETYGEKGEVDFQLNKHTWQGEFKNGKLDAPSPLAQPPKCPECGSLKNWKDGVRSTKNGEVQRWLCRICGYRFSNSKVEVDVLKQGLVFSDSMHNLGNLNSVDRGLSEIGFEDSALTIRKDVGPHGFSVVEKTINNFLPNSRERQVCVSEREAKNLSQQRTQQKRAAGATKVDKATFKGKIFEFLWWMQKEGYAESTIVSRGSRLRRLVRLKADLFNPESVKEVIATQKNWSIARKGAMVWTYDLWAKWLGIEWEKPNYKPVRKLPFIPLEREIDDLIAGCNKYVAAFLQVAKETGARAGEIYSLTWIDTDFENRTVNITPEKGSNPRIFKVSNKLVAMLNTLPKEHEQIFRHYMKLNYLRRSFDRYRKRTAHKLANPRILKITFHTLRHWKATMEYHKTKDILHVMRLLGHRNIKNTLLYTQLVKPNDNNDEYVSKVARTVDEARSLVETGFEYVCEIEGAKLFRKRR